MMAQEVKKVELDPSKVKGRLVYHTVKRGFDILASGVALVLLSSLFGILTVKIKKEDQKFCQSRGIWDTDTVTRNNLRSFFNL